MISEKKTPRPPSPFRSRRPGWSSPSGSPTWGGLFGTGGSTPAVVVDEEKLPSGKLLHNYMENHHAINGKIHDFYGHFQ